MELLTDDQDIRDVRLWMDFGGNGDYYFNLIEYPPDDFPAEDLKMVHMRVAMSGGNAPHEVKMAVAALYRAMEAANLNHHPKNDK